MIFDVVKSSADSLRSYLNDKYDIKLKSGHAHEIVAAFFGYKSKISLLADKKYPLANLHKAEIIVLSPLIPFVEQRIKRLEDLPSDFPPVQILSQSIYSPIIGNKNFSKKIQSNFHDLAVNLGKDRLQQHIGHFRITPAPQWKTDVKTETTEDAVLFRVLFNYPEPEKNGKHHRDSKVDIKLQKIAGNIGYAEPRSHLTIYSGRFRDPDFHPEFDTDWGDSSEIGVYC